MNLPAVPTAPNPELLAARRLLRQRDDDVARLTAELTMTNSGVVALVTELALNTARLQQTERELRQRNDELKGFAYTVAHDLTAPLRGITGYTQELERKHNAGMGERARFCLSQILTATRNLDHLIEDLLHYSRLDAAPPVLAPVSLPHLVAALLKDRALTIDEQRVEVTLALAVTLLPTWESGLTKVLSNLIDNALKYSRHAQPPQLSIAAEQTATGWHITVRDNGIGFDMRYHDRIYGLFNRLVRAEDFEGTGAGLAIVKKVLEKLGGRVWAESQPGQGATFHVELPGPPSKKTQEPCA